MINLLSESAYIAQTNKIKTAITNKVNAIKASLTRIGAKLGATINWLDDVESTLDDELTAINTELVDKGSTQADDFSEVAEKISDIQTGITPTGQIAITQNGTYDVTDYASASVDVPNDDTELVGILDGTIAEIKNDNVTNLQQYSLYRRTYLIDVEFKNLQTLNNYALDGCSNLEKADIGNVAYISTGAFASCNKLETLILRGASFCKISGVASLSGTPFRNGTGGTAYVPYSLKSTYQSATNWSALESTTFSAIQENLVALNALGVDITDYYEIITELPTSDIATDIVYFIETQTAGTYEQWFYGSGSWVQLADITLGGSV